MIGENLVNLRKRHRFTQEDVAERIGVSRQALAKWERDESMPDMNNCIALAKLYGVSLDDLVYYRADADCGIGIPPRGKYFFGSVTVGERGQIVIPKKAREIFGIHSGDALLLFGDEERGIGIMPQQGVQELMEMIGAEHREKEKNADE